MGWFRVSQTPLLLSLIYSCIHHHEQQATCSDLSPLVSAHYFVPIHRPAHNYDIFAMPDEDWMNTLFLRAIEYARVSIFDTNTPFSL